MTFGEGERALSAWMAENAFVSCLVRSSPWELEDALIAELDLPLNLQGNKRNQFHPVLTAARARCVAQARALPVLPNLGTGGRVTDQLVAPAWPVRRKSRRSGLDLPRLHAPGDAPGYPHGC